MTKKVATKKRRIEENSSILGDVEMDDGFIGDDIASEKSFRSATSKNLMAATKVKAPKEPKQAVTIIQGYTPEIQVPFQPNASGAEEKRRYLGTNSKSF